MSTELNPALIDDLWQKADDVFDSLKNLSSTWPVLHGLKSAQSVIDGLKPHAAAFKKYENVVILGTGGSSLGGQALTALSNQNQADNVAEPNKKPESTKTQEPTKSPELHFIDNIDSSTFHTLLSTLNPLTTGVLAISKSGNTAETLMQTLTLLQTWNAFDPTAQMRIITENKDNGMRDVARHYTIECIDHPDDVGGRFSVFSCVALLPALIKGIDVSAFCHGALSAYFELEHSSPKTCQALSGALLQVAHAQSGVGTTVLFAYSNALAKFCEWFCQLWAESLGKKDVQGNAQGTTPVKAIGAIDQHSQLQLYLEGPRDKFYTVITCEKQQPTIALDLPDSLKHPSVTALNHRSMGELMTAEQNSTIDTLRRHGCPLRRMAIDTLDEANLGSLMMHFMLETLAAARFLNVNPFDQPAVEEGKVLAIEYLRKSG